MERRAFLAQGTSATAFVLAAGLGAPGLASVLTNEKPSRGSDIVGLSKRIAGGIYLPGAPDYERLRRGYAAKIDLHPAVIAHCTSADDVRAAVIFAKTNGMPLAVRCGGHGCAGYSACDGGLVIDLSGLRHVEVDRNAMTVRVGGGALVGDIDRATAAIGAATMLGQCPSVGVGGLALGGGVGFLVNKFGMACDNIESVDLVLADGRSVIASARENVDLFWAIRGGGGNFGVATSLTMRMHSVTQVLAGNLIYRMDGFLTLMRMYREFVATAPDELTLLSVITAGPDGKPLFVVQPCYCGDFSAGERALSELRKSEYLVADTVKVRDYLSVQSDIPADVPATMAENRAGFLPEMTDAAIEMLGSALAKTPAAFTISLVHFHGAQTRVPIEATAFPLRQRGFLYGITADWHAPSDRDFSTNWVDDLANRLGASSIGSYVNVMDRESGEAVRAAYGPNYARLAKIKSRYDPSNLFALNQNIKPAVR